MRTNHLLITLLLLSISSITSADEIFKSLGSYDNVKASNTGHCYGTSISLWKIKNNKIIGLLDIHADLCGDPPCSVVQGSIKNNTVSFKTNMPIYDKSYSFTGNISNAELSGSLNKIKSKFNINSFSQSYKDIKSWCSAWSKVSRCNGVKKYCE